MDRNSFEFGEFQYDANEKVLMCDGMPVSVRPKVLQILEVLLKNRGHIVEKDVLMDEVWADSFVEDSNLTFSIRQLRKILGDDSHAPRYIETIPKRGYRFIANVQELSVGNGLSVNEVGLHDRFESESAPAGWRSRPVFYVAAAVLATVFLLLAGFLAFRERDSVRSDKRSEFSDLKFEAITSSDKPIDAAISPDGRFVAYTNTANGQQSLWLRQLSSGTNAQIVAPEQDVLFRHVEFSGDGEYIYFTRRYRNERVHLDRVSVLGGSVKTNILDDIDGAFSISPDDTRISFRRYEPGNRSLLIANTDGTNVRTIFDTPKTFTDNAFSPDGKKIAFASGQSDTGDRDFGVYIIDIDTGDVGPAADFKWLHARGIAWLPDQSRLLVTGVIKSGTPLQLWKISLPAGEVEKITDTQNDFHLISATKDLSKVLLTQNSRSSNLYLASLNAPDDVLPIAGAFHGVAWTPEGNLVYSATSSGNHDLWSLSGDRVGRKQLTTEDSSDISPRVSPDGRYVVFVSDRSGKNNLWRMNADGSNPVQLTHDEGEQTPLFVPDGQFVVYTSVKDFSLWKIPIEGGMSEQISDKRAYGISISPDGTKFAHFSRSDGNIRIVVESFPNRAVLQEFEIPEGHFAGRRIVWTIEGNALIYSAEDTNSVGNLWLQPLNGGVRQKLTHYNADEIFHFDISRDGSHLALIRGAWTYDVVIAQGLAN
jgi:Tol biopolymer transport system component/DNA-binding winged helix-turn-helix (wHTH) protein